MSRDLILLPLDGDRCSFKIVLCDFSEKLFNDVAELGEKIGRDVPLDFNCYLSRREDGETQYGNVIEDDNGNPLKMVSASRLASVFDRNLPLCSDRFDENYAIMEYLNHLNPRRQVVLFWK